MGLSHKYLPAAMKAALRAVYPPQCLSCAVAVDHDGALCPECWRECEFITGHACQGCGVPLPGGGEPVPEDALSCDDCLAGTRPWRQARAAMVYRGVGRDLVLALKHGDRPDLATPLGLWLTNAASPLVRPGMIVVPIPLHPCRLMSRKFNQAALLSAQLARLLGLSHCPSMLTRTRSTPAQDHRSAGERFDNLRGALEVTLRHRTELSGRPILLVDDVMASGATISAATEALRTAGSGPVYAAILARAVKD